MTIVTVLVIGHRSKDYVLALISSIWEEVKGACVGVKVKVTSRGHRGHRLDQVSLCYPS